MALSNFICALIIVTLTSGNSIQAQTNVPHIFSKGTPAKSTEVNKNFSELSSAIDNHWSRYPNRFYPNWRYDPTFYLELPTVGGKWVGRINEDGNPRHLNFINKYEASNAAKRIWFGIDVESKGDIDAYFSSYHKSGVATLSCKATSTPATECPDNIYSFAMSHHKDGSYANINWSIDPTREYLYGSSSNIWYEYLNSNEIISLVNQIYVLLKVENEDVAKFCETVSIHLNGDGSISVTGSECDEIFYEQ